jgi:hypothetical protein
MKASFRFNPAYRDGTGPALAAYPRPDSAVSALIAGKDELSHVSGPGGEQPGQSGASGTSRGSGRTLKPGMIRA